MPNHLDRRTMLKIAFEFVCSCPACTNEKLYQMFFARYSPTVFTTLLNEAPKSLKGALNEFKKNSESLKKCFEHHPSDETVNLQFRNFVLIRFIEKYANIPFVKCTHQGRFEYFHAQRNL